MKLGCVLCKLRAGSPRRKNLGKTRFDCEIRTTPLTQISAECPRASTRPKEVRLVGRLPKPSKTRDSQMYGYWPTEMKRLRLSTATGLTYFLHIQPREGVPSASGSGGSDPLSFGAGTTSLASGGYNPSWAAFHNEHSPDVSAARLPHRPEGNTSCAWTCRNAMRAIARMEDCTTATPSSSHRSHVDGARFAP